jgi:hypothetical protein
VLAVGGLLGRGSEAGDVRAGKGLGDGQTKLLLAAKDLVGNLLLPRFVLGKVEHGSQTNRHAGHVAVLETAGHCSGELLRNNHVMEVVKLFALYRAIHQVDAVQMLARAKSHVENSLAAHEVNHVLANGPPGGFAFLSLRDQMLVGEFTQGLLQAAVGVVEVRVLEVLDQPQRLGVGNWAEVAGLGNNNLGLLILDSANGKVGVLGQNLLTMQIVEGGSGVLPGNLVKHAFTTRVSHDELGEVIDDAVNDAP